MVNFSAAPTNAFCSASYLSVFATATADELSSASFLAPSGTIKFSSSFIFSTALTKDSFVNRQRQSPLQELTFVSAAENRKINLSQRNFDRESIDISFYLRSFEVLIFSLRGLMYNFSSIFLDIF